MASDTDVDTQANRHRLLRAIGINPVALRSATATLQLHLPEIEQLIATGIKVDGCRDRYGSTALGIAAQLGRVPAMKLLLEAGASIEAANLDEATPLSLAVFGRSAAAVAMLLVYGGEHIEYGEAMSDARATGAKDVIAIFEAWEEGESHPLLEEAEQQHLESEAVIAARKEAAAGGGTSPAHSCGTSSCGSRRPSGSSAELKAQADAAESRAAYAEERLRLADERAAEWEARALAAEAQLERKKKYGWLPDFGIFDKGTPRGGSPAHDRRSLAPWHLHPGSMALLTAFGSSSRKLTAGDARRGSRDAAPEARESRELAAAGRDAEAARGQAARGTVVDRGPGALAAPRVVGSGCAGRKSLALHRVDAVSRVISVSARQHFVDSAPLKVLWRWSASSPCGTPGPGAADDLLAATTATSSAGCCRAQRGSALPLHRRQIAVRAASARSRHSPARERFRFGSMRTINGTSACAHGVPGLT